MVVQLAEGKLKTKFGECREVLFYDGQQEAIALILGDIQGGEQVLCRIHSSCVFGHYFNSIECDCREQMELSQQMIQTAGKGLVILLDQEGKGNGHFALLKSLEYKRKGMKQAEAYEAVGFKKDARDFRIAAEIILHLGINSVVLISNNNDKSETLTRFGVRVSGIVPAQTNL